MMPMSHLHAPVSGSCGPGTLSGSSSAAVISTWKIFPRTSAVASACAAAAAPERTASRLGPTASSGVTSGISTTCAGTSGEAWCCCCWGPPVGAESPPGFARLGGTPIVALPFWIIVTVRFRAARCARTLPPPPPPSDDDVGVLSKAFIAEASTESCRDGHPLDCVVAGDLMGSASSSPSIEVFFDCGCCCVGGGVESTSSSCSEGAPARPPLGVNLGEARLFPVAVCSRRLSHAAMNCFGCGGLCSHRSTSSSSKTTCSLCWEMYCAETSEKHSITSSGTRGDAVVAAAVALLLLLLEKRRAKESSVSC
eukprot:PhM_4_TR10515/c0_g1_i1/m.53315